MPQLSSSQMKQLQAGLLDAFDQEELTQMVSVELGERLENIAGGSGLTSIVFKLIQWAERRGRVNDLVRGALTERPGNSVFVALAAEFGVAAGSASTAGTPTPTPPSSSQTPVSSGINIASVGSLYMGSTQIDTGGGAFVGGGVNTGGGSFTGRDNIVQGDVVHGDKVGGDKITVGNVSGTGIAIGRGASVQMGAGAGELAAALAPVVDAIKQNADAATQAAALQQIEVLQQELAKGKAADDSRVADILDGLASLVPSAVAAVVSAFGTPLLSGLAGPVTQFVLNKLKRR